MDNGLTPHKLLKDAKELKEGSETEPVVLPPIPAKRYFTIGEVSDLCAVKAHVLRYWEQEFNQLKPVKRRGNRRYYQHHEVLLIRRIRELLYAEGFTIQGAKHRLDESVELPPKVETQKAINALKAIEAIRFADIRREILSIAALLHFEMPKITV